MSFTEDLAERYPDSGGIRTNGRGGKKSNHMLLEVYEQRFGPTYREASTHYHPGCLRKCREAHNDRIAIWCCEQALGKFVWEGRVHFQDAIENSLRLGRHGSDCMPTIGESLFIDISHRCDQVSDSSGSGRSTDGLNRTGVFACVSTIAHACFMFHSRWFQN